LSPQHTKVVEDAVRDGLAAGHEILTLVTSESMSPLIRSGDRVRAAKAELKALRPGDMVLVTSLGESLVTHRYVNSAYIDGDFFLRTKGDQSLTLDPPRPVAGLVGRVVAVLRGEKELDIGRGRGYRVHRVLAWLMISGQRCIDHLPGELPRRVTHRILRWLAGLLAWLAWAGFSR